jgi:hypothetical protein
MQTPQSITKTSRVSRRYLVARDPIQTAEQFIDQAATESSLSGQPYQVRCQGGPPMTSQRWLRDELARLRSLR